MKITQKKVDLINYRIKKKNGKNIFETWCKILINLIKEEFIPIGNIMQ